MSSVLVLATSKASPQRTCSATTAPIGHSTAFLKSTCRLKNGLTIVVSAIERIRIRESSHSVSMKKSALTPKQIASVSWPTCGVSARIQHVTETDASGEYRVVLPAETGLTE